MRWLLPLLLLTACHHRCQWSEQDIACTRTLTYRTKDLLHGIDLEFLSTPDILTTYLNLHNCPLNTAEVTLTLTGNDRTFTFASPVHEGGQRIHLTPAAQSALLSLLQDGHTITLSFPGYCEEVDPHCFPKLFARIDRPLFHSGFRLFF